MAEVSHSDTRSDRGSAERARSPAPAPVITGGLTSPPIPLFPGPDGDYAALLARADPNKRAEVVLELQQTYGNDFVQRLFEPGDAGADPGEEAAPQFPALPARMVLNAGQVKWGLHGGFPGVMGQTYYARHSIEIWPSFKTQLERSLWPWGWQAKVQTTDAAGGIWDALATPENEEGYKLKDERPEYPGYEVYVRVSSSAAESIAFAEQQHINDLDTGWEITGMAAKKAINAAAAEDADVAGDEVSAKKAAVKKTVKKMGALGKRIKGALESEGRLEDALGPMMDNAFRQSKAKRDDSNAHKIPVNYVMVDDEKKRVLYEVDPDFKIDPTPSSSVVNLDTIG